MNYLFIYGTLLLSDNPWGIYLSQKSKLLCRAKFRGRLYSIGKYPGAVYDPKTDLYVHGSVMSLQHPDEALRIMDEYEGFGPNESQPNEFIRKQLEVESENGPILCWVYLYNRPLKGLLQIESGDYIKFQGENS